MGQTVQALIEHRLTPDEILKLPESLQDSSNSIIAGQWNWIVPNINATTLVNLWTRKAEYFISNSWSEKDLALLRNDNMTLHFYNSNLVTFDNSISWNTYNEDENLCKDFNYLTKEMSTLLNALDIIIVPELSRVPFF